MKLVINFFGGPGCGKSTMASRLFSELKSKGVKCEYVTEYAKDVRMPKIGKSYQISCILPLNKIER